MMMRGFVRVVLVVVAAVPALASRRALAQEAEAPPAPPVQANDPKQQARDLYEEGKRLYNVGEFERAIAAWKKGYELHPSADFLFNIGQAYRRKPDNRQAVFFFERYLREKPNAANREEVEKTLAELKEAIAKEPVPDSSGNQATPAGPVSAPGPSGPAPDPSAGASMRMAGLITAGAGVAVAATGVVFLVMARSTASDLEKAAVDHEPWSQELIDKERSGERNATLGLVGAGVGAAAIVGGGVLYFLGWRQGRATASASVSPGGVSAQVELRF